MKRLRYGTPEFEREAKKLYNRPAYPPEAEKAAAEIIEAVRKDGDKAIVRYAEKFDGVKLAPADFRVTEAEIDAAAKQLAPADKRAIRQALKQVAAFARMTRPYSWHKCVRKGVTVGEKFTPLDRVGVYIPGGSAPLVSTVIHTEGIAYAAGVRSIAAATPAKALHPATLFAMREAGVTEIYRLGGVYGVAALALGTKTIRKVDKIVGPGNAYVTAAKKLLYGEVGIDLVAGPSEILVLADESADPELIAADLLSQAEHGSGLEQSVLVSTSGELIDRVAAEFDRQKRTLPKLAAIEKVEKNGLFLIEAPNLAVAEEIAGSYAPEHLELHVADPEDSVRRIRAAGAIFLGPWTPESAGDFCAGPSHVLPTAGSALRFNGIETATFLRRTSLVKYSYEAIYRESEIIERFGNMESLAAHARAGTVRRGKSKN
ncbi:MAG: histidinol dehydrogenase [Lentisphaeria bacterium]|nr:histidinol dehydrogenase [Lentisphaeria bacterium]